MSNFQKLVSGIPTGTQVQGTDIGSGSATSVQPLFANGSAGSAFRSIVLTDFPAIASDTILGNNAGTSAIPIALSVAQVNAILPVFTSSLNGLAPLSGGGTTNFLRADGTWTTPPAPSLTSLGIFSGKTTIGSGVTTISITYSTAFSNTNYSVVGTILNVTDTSPQYIPVTITAQSTTGATFSWNTPTLTANNVMSWQAIVNN